MFKQYKDTDYDINEKGECFSHKSNRLLKPQMSNKYPTYNLTYPNGKKKKTYVHRMVAEVFLEKIEGKDIVNHKDGNTHNFSVSNLEWVTSQENTQHAHDIGLIKIGDQNINLYNTNLYNTNLNNEKWININNYPNYKVSSYGRIMNIRTKRLLKQHKNSHGYLEVNLYKNNRGKTFQVHSVVYHNFKEEDTIGFIVNHIDGNKTNNNINNLEKITYKENNLHAEYVINTHQTKKPVAQYNDLYELVNTFPSIAQAQRKTGINNISRAIKNKSKAGSYFWQFINK